jgi:hypothetical protein
VELEKAQRQGKCGPCTDSRRAGLEPSLAHLQAQPSRNLSAYNYYFKLKRQQILDQSEASATTTDKEPSSCRKLGFAGLARTVAEQWKCLGSTDPKLKQACEQLAALDKTRYKLELEEWHASKHAGTTASEDVSGLFVDLSIASLVSPHDTSGLAHIPLALPTDPSSTETVSGTVTAKELAFSGESEEERSAGEDALKRRPSSSNESVHSVPPSKSADTPLAVTSSLKPIDPISPQKPIIERDDVACKPSHHPSNPESFPQHVERSDSSVLLHQAEATTNDDDEHCQPRTKHLSIESAINVPCCEPADIRDVQEHLGSPGSNELDPLPWSQGLSRSTSHYDLDILFSLAWG